MKRTLSCLLILSLLFSLLSCAEAPQATTAPETTETMEEKDNTTIRLMAMTGPTGMGLASLIHNDKEGSGNKCDYTIELVGAPDQVVPAIANKTCDIAAVPINLSSTLYAKTNGQVQVLCANTLGVLYMVENKGQIQSVADLAGKTICAPNPGSTPEYILRYVLKENGLDPEKDVTLKFVDSGDAVAAELKLNPDAVGLLPEPKVSAFLTQNTNYKIALNMTEEWDRVAGKDNTLIQGVFVARTEFIKEHPQLIKDFLDDYNVSQNLVNTDMEKGANLVVEAGIIPQAPLAQKAIPGCNITFLEGEEMKKGVEKCLQVLFEAAPKSVGGALPKADFYYTR